MESYISSLSLKDRQAVNRLRLSDNKQQIEICKLVGTVNRPLWKSERTCPFCPTKIEDEYHFLAVCPIMYMDKRNRLKSAFDIKVDETSEGNHNFFSRPACEQPQLFFTLLSLGRLAVLDSPESLLTGYFSCV